MVEVEENIYVHKEPNKSKKLTRFFTIEKRMVRRLWLHTKHRIASLLERLNYKKVIRNLLLTLFFVFAIWVCNLIWFKPFSISLFYERMFIEYGLDDPELMSRLQLLEKYGIKSHNSKLTDISDSERDRRYQESIVRNFEMLRTYKKSQQTPEEQLSTEILDWYLELEVLRHAYRQFEYPVNHINGIQVELPRFMTEVHQIETLGDAEDYLERLSKFDDKFDQLILLLKDRRENNVIPPKFILERVIQEIRDFVSRDVEYNQLYRYFVRKLEYADRILPLAKHELQVEAKSIIEDDVYPAYRKLLAYLEDELKIANNDAGVWKLGFDSMTAVQYYNTRLWVHAHTSQDESPEEYHYRGLAEIKDLKQELWLLLDSLGYSRNQPLSVHLAKINENQPSHFSTDEEFKLHLEEYQHYSDTIYQVFPFFFDGYPKEPLTVLRVPLPLEKDAPLLDFYGGSQKSKPALYVNLKEAQHIPANKMPVWIYEKAGGRHIQAWYEDQIDNLPTFRKVLEFEVYYEGWEGYFIDLIYQKENGINYFPTINEQIGRIQHELFITSLLVVDTGIHLRKWSREKAVDFLVENTGLPREKMIDEVDKIVVNPAQATIYKIGKIHFMRLREYAQDELEDNFDDKEFHKVLLQNGDIPIPVLKKQVEQYVVQKKKVLAEQ